MGEKNFKKNQSYIWNLEKWYRRTYFQSSNRETIVENKHVDTKCGKGGVNWETGTDVYTLLCTKQKTNENLQNSTGNSVLC